jgi:cytochrome oxidase assembly protein ShyY1
MSPRAPRCWPACPKSCVAPTDAGRVELVHRGYTQEASWRKDNRRLSNGEQVGRIAGLAMVSKPSVDFAGYWQGHIRAE